MNKKLYFLLFDIILLLMISGMLLLHAWNIAINAMMGFFVISSLYGIAALLIKMKKRRLNLKSNIKYLIPVIIVSVVFIYFAFCNLQLIISNNLNYLNVHKILWILFIFFILIGIGQTCLALVYIVSENCESVKKIMLSIYISLRSLLYLFFLIGLMS